MEVRSDTMRTSGIKAFIDTGADLTIVSARLAKRLHVKKAGVEIAWMASNGSRETSPIGRVRIRAEDDESPILREDVLIDDAPMDPETGEQVILGLDYLQKGKKVLDFDD